MKFNKYDLVQITGDPELFGKEFEFRMYVESMPTNNTPLIDCIIFDRNSITGEAAGRYAQSSTLRLSSKRKVLVEII